MAFGRLGGRELQAGSLTAPLVAFVANSFMSDYPVGEALFNKVNWHSVERSQRERMLEEIDLTGERQQP
jgi:hypothetical protein